MAAVPLNVTEWMKGYVAPDVTDADAGFMKGFAAEALFMHKILIHIDDVDRFMNEPGHAAKVEGAIICEPLGGKCRVTDGTFNIRVDPRNADLKLMFYKLPFTNSEGVERTMVGHKTINRHDGTFDVVQEISRLAVRIYQGSVPGLDSAVEPVKADAAPPPPPIAMGQLYIETLDGFRSAHSFRLPHASPADAAKAIEKFGAFYMDRLWKVYSKTAPHPA